MKTQFATTTLLSVYAWLDNLLLQKGQAYTNVTTQFYYQPDARLGTGFVTYQAPFMSFVWDSGVSGATIFNTVSGTTNGVPFTLSRGQSGMMTDFVNGRVILPASFGTTAVVSGSYAFKDFNIYFANQSQERMLFSNKYYLNSRFALTGRPPAYDMVTPAIFITNGNSENLNWAMGGVYNTTFTIALNVLAENMSQLEGALSILNDQKDASIPQLGTATWPLNFYGDYKPSGWNYQNEIAQYGTPGNLYFISKVRCSKASDYAKFDEAILLGLCDLTIQRVRANIH